jgi:hypothetical protein
MPDHRQKHKEIVVEDEMGVRERTVRRLRQDRLPDEDLRELLRYDSKLLVIGPHKRSYAETAAYVDKVRKTKRWAKLCVENIRLSPKMTLEDARAVAFHTVTLLLMQEFVGDKVPVRWVDAYLAVPESQA